MQSFSKPASWRCVKQCGACCHLDPSDRPDLDQYLTSAEMTQYLSMVGEDGWCVNFDPATRECRIYDERPRFCRVEPEIFQNMYGVQAADFNGFAIHCCHQQIAGVYGDLSPERRRFDQELGLAVSDTADDL